VKGKTRAVHHSALCCSKPRIGGEYAQLAVAMVCCRIPYEIGGQKMPTVATSTVTAVLTLAVVGLVAPTPAMAYNVEACAYSSATVHYYDGSSYATATRDAAEAWTATSTPINMESVGDSGTYQFSVVTANFGSGHDGLTYYTCSGGYMSNFQTSYYNSFYTSGYSTTARKQLMVHEMGHELGLDHAGTSTCSGQPIMYPNSSRYFTCNHQNPQPDDIDGINSLY